MLSQTSPSHTPNDSSESGPGTTAFQLALILAVVYCLFCAVYVVLSSGYAARISQSLPEMLKIETIKGLAFVLVTGVLFFGFAWALLTRLEAGRERLRKQATLLVDVEQRSLAGLFAGSIAHDINNMLTVAQCQLGELSDIAATRAAGDLAARATAVESSLQEISKLSGRLAKIGLQQPRGEWIVGELSTIVARAVTIGRQHLRVRRCDISLSLEPTPASRHNTLLVTRSVINLLINAGDATAGRGRVEIKLFREGDYYALEVHDNGPGVRPEDADRVFEEYFTTKPDGTGLGLVIVAVCAREHGGIAQVKPSELGGACFRMSFAARETQSLLPA
jgi:signal transduction histidine kinase